MKKKNWLKIILFSLLTALVLLVVSACFYIAAQYNAVYAPVDIVTRSDSYVVPELPEVEFTPPDEEVTEDFFVESEISSPEIEDSVTVHEETTEIAPESTTPVTTVPETPVPTTTITETTVTVTTIPETTAPATTMPETTVPVTTIPETTAPVTTAPVTVQTAAPVSTQAATTSKPPAVTTSRPASNEPKEPLSVYKGIPIYEVKQREKNIVNILLLGTDSRDTSTDRGRSDTMIIISCNTDTGEIKLVSLLRDSLVPIEGYDWNRINTAYIFGGVGLAVNTVNQIFGLDIQKFIVVDMEGVQDFIDYYGGLDVTLSQAEVEYYNTRYKTEYVAGVNHLDSRMLINHLRNRTVGSDFERSRRQRDVLTTLLHTTLAEKNLGEILDLIQYSTTIFQTNIDIATLTSLATTVVTKKDSLKVTAQNVPFSDAYQFAWYKKMAIIYFDITEAAARLDKFLYD